jgi:O-acetyl-ADP-ribose deacetylase (regulator of RNase III)
MIHYLVGDATLPEKTPALICHIVNDIGMWGAGFVIAITQRFGKGPESAYRLWSQEPDFTLGKVQFVTVNKDITIANMVAQSSLRSRDNPKPLSLNALKICLKQVYSYAENEFTVHMPRIGCGLAGGTWQEVEPIIKRAMTVDTYVYDFEVK